MVRFCLVGFHVVAQDSILACIISLSSIPISAQFFDNSIKIEQLIQLEVDVVVTFVQVGLVVILFVARVHARLLLLELNP